MADDWSSSTSYRIPTHVYSSSDCNSSCLGQIHPDSSTHSTWVSSRGLVYIKKKKNGQSIFFLWAKMSINHKSVCCSHQFPTFDELPISISRISFICFICSIPLPWCYPHSYSFLKSLNRILAGFPVPGLTTPTHSYHCRGLIFLWEFWYTRTHYRKNPQGFQSFYIESTMR